MSDISVPLGRDPEVAEIAQYFDTSHLTHPEARQASMACARVAQEMILRLKDGPELTAGLRKLLEAKDCFVRASLPSRSEASSG
jgi:hypothetical protein